MRNDVPVGTVVSMINRIPIVRVCAEDGEIIESFLLKPGEHIDFTLTKEQQRRKPARLVCDG